MPAEIPADRDRFLKGIAALVVMAKPFEGVVYRAVTPRFARSHDAASGEPGKLHHGRWTPAGLGRAMYASLDPETALAESLAHHRYFGIPVDQALPKVIVSIEVRLGRLVDLTAPRSLRVLGIDVKELTDCDWRRALDTGVEPITHALGRVLYELKAEGALAPSGARHGSRNIVVFPDHFTGGSRVRARGLDNPS